MFFHHLIQKLLKKSDSDLDFKKMPKSDQKDSKIELCSAELECPKVLCISYLFNPMSKLCVKEKAESIKFSQKKIRSYIEWGLNKILLSQKH